MEHHKKCTGNKCHLDCNVVAIKGEKQLPEFKNSMAEDRIVKKVATAIEIIGNQHDLIAALILFHDAVGNAMDLQRTGYTNGWKAVRKMMDVISDKYDLNIFRESIGD